MNALQLAEAREFEAEQEAEAMYDELTQHLGPERVHELLLDLIDECRPSYVDPVDHVETARAVLADALFGRAEAARRISRVLVALRDAGITAAADDLRAALGDLGVVLR